MDCPYPTTTLFSKQKTYEPVIIWTEHDPASGFFHNTPSPSIFGYAGETLMTYLMVDQCGVGSCDGIWRR